MPFLSPYGLKHRRFELWVEHTVKNIVKLDIWLNFVQFYGVSQPLYEIEAAHQSCMSSGLWLFSI